MPEKPMIPFVGEDIGLSLFSADDGRVSSRLLGLTASRTRGPLGEAREIAFRLRRALPPGRPCDPRGIARDSGFLVEEDCWEAAGGARVYLGELDGYQRTIRTNQGAIRQLEELLAGSAIEEPWNSTSGIASAVVAHELYHGLRPGTQGLVTEAAAHAFARTLLAMPFSPLLYDWWLSRFANRTARITAGPGSLQRWLGD